MRGLFPDLVRALADAGYQCFKFLFFELQQEAQIRVCLEQSPDNLNQLLFGHDVLE